MRTSRLAFVVAALTFAGAAFATSVEWTLSPVSFDGASPVDTTVQMFIKDWPAGKDIDGASIYLQYDKTKFSLTNVTWNTAILDQAGTVEYPDGTVLFSGKVNGTGNPTNTTVMLTFKIHPLVTSLPAGSYPFGPKTPDPNTVLTANGAQPVEATWNPLNLTVVAAPNPPRDVTAAATTPQKDPVRITLSWTDRHADDFEMQWKRPSESSTAWKNVTTGMVEDIGNKTIDWTTQGTPGFGTYETIQIRVRVLDGGKVWSGSAVVDAATNPNVGWKQVPNNVVVDNDPPGMTGATGTNGTNKVTVVFDEPVQGGYSGNPDHFAVHWSGHPDIEVTAAQPITSTSTELTLASPLSMDEEYTVTATDIPDWIGNFAATLGPVPVVIQANPPRDVAWPPNGLPAATKDPVVGQLTWGPYPANQIQVQYSENGTTWTNATVVADLNAKTFTWTTGFTSVKTVYIRARVLDHGKVWSGTAVVDAAANPNAGWVQWGATVRVDNVPPSILTATATSGDNKVYVTYNEDVADSAANPANYTVKKIVNGQETIAVTGAQFQGSSRQVVVLTLATAITDEYLYNLFADNISDVVGNQAPQMGTSILFKPKLLSAALKQDGQNRTVEVLFNVPMQNIGTRTQWSLVVVGGSSVTISAVAIDPSDPKKVNVTTSAALAQNTQYRVTCPATATSTAGQQVGADHTAVFTTPFWRAFTVDAARVYSVGIPFDVGGGRVRTLLGASAVAAYDPTGPTWTVDTGGATQVAHQIGRGYFAKWASSGSVTAYMTGTPVAPPQTLTVPAGWNLITNPFLTDLSLSQVSLGGTPFRYAWWWDGSQYRLVANVALPPIGAETQLRPWVGYWVKAVAGGTIQLGGGGPVGAPVPLALGGNDAVLVPLVARAGDAQDAVCICGVGQSAEAVANPPFAAGSVDLAFLGGPEPLAIDVRTGTVAQKWDLLCKTDLPNVQVTISAADLSRLPRDYTVLLTDLDTGKKTYLRTSAGYTFTAGPQGAERRLTLEILPRSATALVTAVAVAQAEAGRVVVTYGLSAPASVTAEVMNIAGRMVKRLAVERPETAGSHTLSWDLTNSVGSVVPRGTYLLTIVARTEDGQQVKAVRAFTVSR